MYLFSFLLLSFCFTAHCPHCPPNSQIHSNTHKFVRIRLATNTHTHTTTNHTNLIYYVTAKQLKRHFPISLKVEENRIGSLQKWINLLLAFVSPPPQIPWCFSCPTCAAAGGPWLLQSRAQFFSFRFFITILIQLFFVSIFNQTKLYIELYWREKLSEKERFKQTKTNQVA